MDDLIQPPARKGRDPSADSSQVASTATLRTTARSSRRATPTLAPCIQQPQSPTTPPLLPATLSTGRRLSRRVVRAGKTHRTPQFSALLAVASRIGRPARNQAWPTPSRSPTRPTTSWLWWGAGHRGAEACDALADFLSRVAYASTTDTPLAPGPSLEQIDRELQNDAVFICAYWLGSGLMTMAVDGGDQEGLLREVRALPGGAGVVET